jgi:glutamate dehydrogenase
MAFKFDPARVPELPAPRPHREIWICSPTVEGVHLRGGSVARGGIRWSDRREDFRTEVLGLVKAQMVKNAVIVPTGAKGGFVVKRATASPEEFRAAGLECYRQFIAGLLDVTDNIVAGSVVPPPQTVRWDDDDPYLVVAADKGTAAFSDVANEIAVMRGFWLADAFASGGSAGYDHKAMGITARGAWESVRRHARHLGKDADADPLTVVGVGDMSGDVFGNGMLRSANIRLLAAFDHRHVFVDPDPDPRISFAERSRLFAMPRSSWADYDASLISDGGGVFDRAAKSIELSAEARRVLGIETAVVTPNELVSAVLRAPVDLLWNGGIGTYVKSSSETNADVGDRANDAVRVNGIDLRCHMVAEGGNLGLTQRGRVEYALAGGLVHTDAIDNSAGVDCSDHEVNIKILLGAAVAAGELTMEARNELLVEMTDEVADQVLDDNRAQTLALAVARARSADMVNVHARYLKSLETEGWIDRALEDLPSEKQIVERRTSGGGLTAPEFAVLMAYTKTSNIDVVGRSNLPDEPVLRRELAQYFPVPLRERFDHLLDGHPLRCEIITTRLCNQMVNMSGITFDHRITEETGIDVVEVTRAWVAARDIVDAEAAWDEIESIQSAVRADVQIELLLEVRQMIERTVLWLLRHGRPPLDIAAAVVEFREPVQRLASGLDDVLTGRMRDLTFAREAGRLAAGVPERLAQRSSQWPVVHTFLDIVRLAGRTGAPVAAVARTYWEMFEVVDAGWVWDAIGSMPRSDRWQTQARSALRDDLLAVLADLTEDVLGVGSVDAWTARNERSLARAAGLSAELRRSDALELTTLTVALRQLRNVVLSSPHDGR